MVIGVLEIYSCTCNNHVIATMAIDPLKYTAICNKRLSMEYDINIILATYTFHMHIICACCVQITIYTCASIEITAINPQHSHWYSAALWPWDVEVAYITKPESKSLRTALCHFDIFEIFKCIHHGIPTYLWCMWRHFGSVLEGPPLRVYPQHDKSNTPHPWRWRRNDIQYSGLP